MTREAGALFIRQRFAAQKGKVYVPSPPREPRPLPPPAPAHLARTWEHGLKLLFRGPTPKWVYKPSPEKAKLKAKRPFGPDVSTAIARKWFDRMRWKW